MDNLIATARSNKVAVCLSFQDFSQLNSLIPASKISNLSQGMFVGAVADNFDERIGQKIFHAEIVIDNDKVKAETAAYVPIPEISSFVGEDGKDHMEEIVKENYYRVKADVAELVRREIARIEADPDLAKLLPKKKLSRPEKGLQ